MDKNIKFVLEDSPFKFYKLEFKDLTKTTKVGWKKYLSWDLTVLREKGNSEAKLANLKFELIEQKKDLVRVKSIFSKSQLNLLFLIDTQETVTLRKAIQVYWLNEFVKIVQDSLKSYILIPIKAKKVKGEEDFSKLGQEFIELNKSVFGFEISGYEMIDDIQYAKVMVSWEEVSDPAIQEFVSLSILEDEEEPSNVIYNKVTKEKYISETELMKKYKGWFFSDASFSNDEHWWEDLALLIDTNVLFEQDHWTLDEKVWFWNGGFAGVKPNKDGKTATVYIHNFLDRDTDWEFWNENHIAEIKNTPIRKQEYTTDSDINENYIRTIFKTEYEGGQTDWLEDFLGRYHYTEKWKNILIFEDLYNNLLKYYKDWVVGIEYGEDYGKEGKELLLKVHIGDENWFMVSPIFIKSIHNNKFLNNSSFMETLKNWYSVEDYVRKNYKKAMEEYLVENLNETQRLELLRQLVEIIKNAWRTIESIEMTNSDKIGKIPWFRIKDLIIKILRIENKERGILKENWEFNDDIGVNLWNYLKVLENLMK